jgi:hypothetical protein
MKTAMAIPATAAPRKRNRQYRLYRRQPLDSYPVAMMLRETSGRGCFLASSFDAGASPTGVTGKHNVAVPSRVAAVIVRFDVTLHFVQPSQADRWGSVAFQNDANQPCGYDDKTAHAS